MKKAWAWIKEHAGLVAGAVVAVLAGALGLVLALLRLRPGPTPADDAKDRAEGVKTRLDGIAETGAAKVGEAEAKAEAAHAKEDLRAKEAEDEAKRKRDEEAERLRANPDAIPDALARALEGNGGGGGKPS